MIKNLLNKLNKNEESKNHVIEEYIEKYLQFKSKYPDVTPHSILSKLWIEKSTEYLYIKDRDHLQKLAYLETYNFSCLPEPVNAKALALWFIYKESSALTGLDNQYFREVKKILKPIFLAKKKGDIKNLYNKYNPVLS